MSDYTRVEANGQQAMCVSPSDITFPCPLDGFVHKETVVQIDKSGMTHAYFKGELNVPYEAYFCPVCHHKMVVHEHESTTLSHIPFGSILTSLVVNYTVFYCENCHDNHVKCHHKQPIPFKVENYRITKELFYHTQRLLSMGTLTLKAVGALTGLGQNTVRAIEVGRLKALYTVDGKGEALKKPTRQAKYLGIDEFLLHEGRQYATHITDLETGQVLWIEESKKKDVVYHFIKHVGMEWMRGVEAVSCDMNAHFADAFQSKCKWIQIVFDFFHITKNLGDKLITPVRRDELARLKKEGKEEEAKSLTGSRYILLAARETLQTWNNKFKEGYCRVRESVLFPARAFAKKEIDFEGWYNKILQENKLIFTIDIIKDQLRKAYTTRNKCQMALEIAYIIKLCESTENKHFAWFAKFLKDHILGILSHTDHPISTGRIEGLNNRIKTLRRQGYGIRNTEYFFLKIIDVSNSQYSRMPPIPENWY